MTATRPAPNPATVQAPDGGPGELVHLVCCQDDDLALCGVDLTGHPWAKGGPDSCVVCEDMGLGRTCPRRGHCPDTVVGGPPV